MLGKIMVTFVVALFLVCGADGDVSPAGSPIYNQMSSITKFSFNVDFPSIQQWTLGLESCPEIQPVSSIPATSLSIRTDSLTQISGITWFGIQSVYVINLRGHVKPGTTSWGVVIGPYKSLTGIVSGPACSYYDDVVCNPGGPYYGECHNHALNVHLLGHASLHAVSYSWDHFIPGANLLSPNSVASVLSLPTNLCFETYRVSLTVVGQDPSDKRTCVAYIFVEDSTAPVLHNIYERDISAEPHDIPVPMLLTAEDKCDPNVVIKFREDRVETDHPCSYQLHRTWTASDECGNVGQHTQVVSVIDTSPPVLSGVEKDATYECDVVPPPCTVEGNDYNEVSVEIREFKTPGPCDCEYTLVRKWVATDCAGNSAEEVQKITVYDNDAPTLYGVPDHTDVDCNEVPVVPSPSATDNCCGSTITFFETTHGGTCPHEKTIVRTWNVMDECGNSDSAVQSIGVVDSEKPVLSSVERDITVECDEIPLPCEVEVSDNCDDYTVVKFEESTQQGTCEDSYVIHYKWSADDMCGNLAVIEQFVHVQDTTDPVFSGLPPHEITVECDSLPTFNVKGKDNCDEDIVVITNETNVVVLYTHDYTRGIEWSITDDCGNTVEYSSTLTVQDNDDPVLIGVPSDIVVSCANIPDAAEVEATDNCCEQYALEPIFKPQTIKGTCEHNYIIVRTWIVSDCSHNTVSRSQSVTVEDNQAPVMHGLPGYALVPCDDRPEKAVVDVTDDCDEEPEIRFFKDKEAGSCKSQYKLLRTWTASDVCGNIVVYTQTIVTFDDHAPVFGPVPPDTTYDCAFPYDEVSPSATDNCDPYIEVLPHAEKKEGTCEYDGVQFLSWIVQDDCGNAATAFQTITIEDVAPPSWKSSLDDMITAEYPTEPDPPVLLATDNCEYEPDITFNEKKLQFGYVCPKAYRLVRAWFVVDRCGNMGPPLYQHVVIDDTEAPVFISTPADATVECDDIPPPYPVHAVDHYEDIVVTLSETTVFGTCNHDYDIIRTWSALDSCGNLNKTSQEITVQDTEKPRFYMVPDDTTAECLTPPPASITAEDNCDGYLDVSLVDERAVEIEIDYTFAERPMRRVFRHWSAQDNCGNVNKVFQTIEVFDTKLPYFVEYPDDVVVECDAIPLVPNMQFRDECSKNIQSLLEIFDDIGGSCEHAETIVRRWVIVDDVQHQATFEQTVEVVDTTPPELKGYSEDSITVECDAVPPHGHLVATDNCDYDVKVKWDDMRVDPFYKCSGMYILFWTWTATDDCGNSASYVKTVNVEDTTPPHLVCNSSYCGDYADVEVECDDDFLNWDLNVSATDNCDDHVSVKYSGVTEHGSCDDAYLAIDSWFAEDDCGVKATYSRTITVVDTTPPYWVETPNGTKSVPYDGNIGCPDQMLANDNCDDNVAVSCVFEIESGVCPQDYTKTCTCKAVDNCGNFVEFVQVINVFDDDPPIIPEIVDTTVECLHAVVAPAEPLVNWGYNTGVVSVVQRTIPQNCTYLIVYTWTATDSCQLYAVSHQSVHVVDNTPPVIFNVPDDETAECHPGAPPGYLNAEDNCDGKVIVLFDQEKIKNNGPFCYTLVRTWTSVDHCGHVTAETQTIIVDDREAPVVSYPPGNITTDCHSVPFAMNEDVIANDNCESHRNVTFEDVKVDGTCECDFKRHRRWVACDSCDNCVTVESTVTVTDDTAPVLSEYCVDVTVQKEEVEYPSAVGASDTYGMEVEVTYTETRHNSSYTADETFLYMLIRHWVAEDDCRNQESHTCTVTVIDTIPVDIIGVPKDITIPCTPDGSYPDQYRTDTITAVVEANLEEGPDISVSVITDSEVVGTCENEKVWIRCWQSEDHVPNLKTVCFTITVVDTQPPEFLQYPQVEFAECEPEGVLQGEVTAQDNCAGGATVTVDEEDFTKAYSGYYVRTWTATDACGHTTHASQTIWVADTVPPTFLNAPDDETLYCADEIPYYNVTASDECHGDPNVVHVQWKEVVCEGEYIIFNDWRAIDAVGNWISHSQQIQVFDGISPVLYAGNFGSYNKATAVQIGDSKLHESVKKECPWTEIHHPVYAADECIEYPWDVPLFSVDRWGEYCQTYYVAYTWKTSDDCGNEAEFSQTVEVVDTKKPKLTGCPDSNVALLCGTPIPKPYVGASDECDVNVQPVRSESLVPGTCDFEYEVHVTWIVEDHCGFTEECNQTIIYEDRQAPVLVLHGPSNVTQQCDESYDVPAVSASDDCQDYFNIDYDLTQVEGTCPCEYQLLRSWSTRDKCGHEDIVTQTVTVEDNEPPTISGYPSDVTVPCLHEPPKPPMSASDNCCEVTLEYSETRDNTSCDLSYTLYRSWVATDECGYTAHYEQTVTVVDNEAPEFTLGGLISKFIKVECDAVPPQKDLTAYDVCQGPIDVDIKYYTHVGDCLDSYFILRHWDATDDCGNNVHLAATVQVVDTTPPVIELPDVDSYECDYVPNESNHNVEANDNCDRDPNVQFTSNILGADCSDNWSVMMMWVVTDRCGNDAIYSMVVAIDDTRYPKLSNVPDDTTVECHLPDIPHVSVEDECDKLLTAHFEQEIAYVECPYNYVAIRRWSATDRCQNTVEDSQRITVTDDGPPKFVSVPDDEKIGCKDHVVVVKVSATDECETVVEVSHEENVIPGSCAFQYVTVLTWIAEDKCGNTITDSQTVTVHDNAPPEMSSPREYGPFPCQSLPTPPHVSAQDDCSYQVEVVFKEHKIDGTCDDVYQLKWVWTAVDECGNHASVERLVQIESHEPPTLPGLYTDITAECWDVPLMPVLTASHICGGYVQYNQGETKINGTCPHEYTLERWFEAVDVCGSTETKYYTVYVEDNDDPTLSYIPPHTTCECDEDCDAPEVLASDSCGYETTVDFTETSIDSTCDEVKKLLRTWTATDECDKTAVHVQTVNVVDTTPPVIDEHEDITAEIGNIPPPWKCRWTDNCDVDGETDFVRERKKGSCEHQFDYIYRCTATDCVGNKATSMHIIHVFDTIAPIIIGVGSDVTVEYSKVPDRKFALVGVSVSDNSDNTGDYSVLEVHLDDDIKIPLYDNSYTLIRNFWAMDACGNRAEEHRTIFVVDRTPPCFDEEPEDISVECDAIPEPCEIFTVGEDLHVDFFEMTRENTYGQSIIIRKWKACDKSANCNSHRQTVTVDDTTPPVFTRIPDNETLPCDCEGFPAMANLAAIDNCDDFVTVKHSEVEDNVVCPDEYKLIRKWVATDHVGLTSTAIQTIQIVDDAPPTLSHPDNMDIECDELVVSNLPKLTVFDNCADDIRASSQLYMTQDLDCTLLKSYIYWANDNCGNLELGYWNLTVSDLNGPIVYGGKHCIYNRSDDGYGSDKLYKVYNLVDLVSASDDCDDSPEIQSVWFNRTEHDQYNHITGPFIRKSSGSYICASQTETSWNETWSYRTTGLIVGKTYMFSVSARQSPCSITSPSTESGRTFYVGSGVIYIGGHLVRNVNPPKFGDWHRYEMYFTPDVPDVDISLTSEEGVVFGVASMVDFVSSEPEMADEVSYFGNGVMGVPSLISHVGAGEWVDVYSTFQGRIIDCEEEKEVSDMTHACATLSVAGSNVPGIYEALPMLSDDRYIYRSTTHEWSSISHYRFDASGKVFWILSNFADMNPTAYSWNTLQRAIDIYLDKDLGDEEILRTLVTRGTITAWWPEKTLGDPIPDIQRPPYGEQIQVTCEDNSAVSKEQCEGACYYMGFTHAILYDADSRLYAGECSCGRGCSPNENGIVFQGGYQVWKWHEGFFFNKDANEVWILAKTYSDDLNIYMWVAYVDDCGNQGTGKVEFWIAPSVEAAAAQGRNCDEADTDPQEYVQPFAFTSDDRIFTDHRDLGSFADKIGEALDSEKEEHGWGVDGETEREGEEEIEGEIIGGEIEVRQRRGRRGRRD